MNNMDKKVLIYCRVSTQQQTTDRQKEELLKFAAENHWNVEEEDICKLARLWMDSGKIM